MVNRKGKYGYTSTSAPEQKMGKTKGTLLYQTLKVEENKVTKVFSIHA